MLSQCYDTSDNKLRREFESYGSIKTVSSNISAMKLSFKTLKLRHSNPHSTTALNTYSKHH